MKSHLSDTRQPNGIRPGKSQGERYEHQGSHHTTPRFRSSCSSNDDIGNNDTGTRRSIVHDWNTSAGWIEQAGASPAILLYRLFCVRMGWRERVPKPQRTTIIIVVDIQTLSIRAAARTTDALSRLRLPMTARLSCERVSRQTETAAKGRSVKTSACCKNDCGDCNDRRRGRGRWMAAKRNKQLRNTPHSAVLGSPFGQH